MIQISVSKPLAKPLGRHLKPARDLLPDLYWYAEVEMFGAFPCVVAQEQYTQYLMVFCALTEDDFSGFPQLFRERFCREAAAICKQAGLYDDQTLTTHLAALCEEQHIHLNPEPMEEGPISRTFEQLEHLFLYDRLPLPRDGRAAFEFTFPLNNRKPKGDRAMDKPRAAEAMGDLCLNLVEDRLAGAQAKPAVMSVSDNIVRVDFARQRNS